MRLFFTLLCLVTLLRGADFSATANFQPQDGGWLIALTLEGPKGGHINAGLLEPKANQGTVKPFNLPPTQNDEMVGEVYPVGAVLTYLLTPKVENPELTVTIQGCTDELCLMPQDIVLKPNATPSQSPVPAATAVPAKSQWRSTAGYVKAPEFCQWIDRALTGEPEPAENLLQRVFDRHGLFLAALLIIPLGLLLNLTPCVLPMIPINLGIIGAGAAGKGGKRGFALGATYGAAMAITYGAAGAIFVSIGGRFGAINSSPWFNLALAAVFIVLALAMFDLIILDFSRFRKRSNNAGRGAFATAAILGTMAALLAGACIAPVLIWVLILSAQLYSDGHAAGLWLPLLLGVGLGLPWPIMGAGVAFLPKPGAWMNRVKQAFGVLIACVAVYYIWTGVTLFRSNHKPVEDGYWLTDYQAAVAEAQKTNKPLFIDFWGVTCKACTMMDATTLQSPEVRQRLDQMVRVKVQADNFDSEVTRKIVQEYGVVGLPTYVIRTWPQQP